MDFNKTVDLIIRDLEEAREIIDDLKNYPEVPEIQIEMAKSKIRNAAEVISLFKSLKPEDGRLTNEVRKFREAEPKIDERSEQPERSGARRSQIPRSGIEDKSLTPEVRRPTPLSNEPEPVVRDISAIVADRFSDLHDSLHEALGLADLSKAIGINDRFLFIRDLFDGNSDSYNQAISKIDEAQSFSDARALMITLAGDKSESDAGKQFLDLVKRKFPGNE